MKTEPAQQRIPGVQARLKQARLNLQTEEQCQHPRPHALEEYKRTVAELEAQIKAG